MINDLKTSGAHISFWTNTVQARSYKPLQENTRTDVVIVGGGMAGISIAYTLASRGREVVVVEDGLIGSGETGRTTAHLVTALDDRYYHIENIYGKEKAKLAAESHAAAIDYIEEVITREHIDCDFERLSGYLFCHPSDTIDNIDKEYEAALRAGLDVKKISNIPGIRAVSGPCIEFKNQGQFHIMKYLNGLCEYIEQHGGRIYTQTHAQKIDDEGITTEDGFTIKASHIVIATNTPVNDRYVIHTKQAPYRTYVIAAKTRKGSFPRALWWDTGNQDANTPAKPYHYIRLQELDTEYDLLISGGEDHVTGVTDTPEENRYALLEQWTREKFPIEEVLYHWSGQVMEPIDSLAFIGHNPMDNDHTYIVTGDSGNGMTHSTIAAMMIPDLIEGKDHPWAKLYDPGRFKVFSAGQTFMKDNMSVLAEWFKGYAGHPDLKDFYAVKKDEGKIVEVKGHKYGAYRDKDQALHIVSAVCPHLKCIIKWNSDEDSWDCPCHGSRFTIDGKVINGPANNDLPYFHYQNEMF
jgi:glycine/D-amino acid oxidase-like deaminating enzyme/nitrite reductase/ring-hydroxylating ferredoxin subunit